MSATDTFFTENGPSDRMESLYTKFEHTLAFVDECYQNRAGFEIPEDDNAITDQQIYYVMEDFIRTVTLMLKNKTENV